MEAQGEFKCNRLAKLLAGGSCIDFGEVPHRAMLYSKWSLLSRLVVACSSVVVVLCGLPGNVDVSQDGD